MHHEFRRFCVLSVVAGLLVAACGGSLGDPTGSPCPPGSTLTYENFGRNFFTQNCIRCHAGQESPTLATLDSIQAHASDIDKAAAAGLNATNDSMPEGTSIPREERLKLGEWLACGAP